MKFHLAKSSSSFIPVSEEDQVKCQKIGQGEVIVCRAVDQRNLLFHRKFFALIKLAWENMPERYDGHFPTPESLREELLIVSGFYEKRKDFWGNEQKKAKSIAFDKMGQEEFETVYSRVLDVVCRLIGVEQADIMDELIGFM